MNNTQQELVEAKKQAIAKVKALLAPVAAANRFMTDEARFSKIGGEGNCPARRVHTQFQTRPTRHLKDIAADTTK